MLFPLALLFAVSSLPSATARFRVRREPVPAAVPAALPAPGFALDQPRSKRHLLGYACSPARFWKLPHGAEVIIGSVKRVKEKPPSLLGSPGLHLGGSSAERFSVSFSFPLCHRTAPGRPGAPWGRQGVPLVFSSQPAVGFYSSV